MIIFASRAEKELKGIIEEIEINLSNNYKDTAHSRRKKLGERTEELYKSGKLSEKKYLQYRRIFDSYTEKMKNYHH